MTKKARSRRLSSLTRDDLTFLDERSRLLSTAEVGRLSSRQLGTIRQSPFLQISRFSEPSNEWAHS
jgi:hypothetical protein